MLKHVAMPNVARTLGDVKGVVLAVGHREPEPHEHDFLGVDGDHIFEGSFVGGGVSGGVGEVRLEGKDFHFCPRSGTIEDDHIPTISVGVDGLSQDDLELCEVDVEGMAVRGQVDDLELVSFPINEVRIGDVDLMPVDQRLLLIPSTLLLNEDGGSHLVHLYDFLSSMKVGLGHIQAGGARMRGGDREFHDFSGSLGVDGVTVRIRGFGRVDELHLSCMELD